MANLVKQEVILNSPPGPFSIQNEVDGHTNGESIGNFNAKENIKRTPSDEVVSVILTTKTSRLRVSYYGRMTNSIKPDSHFDLKNHVKIKNVKMMQT